MHHLSVKAKVSATLWPLNVDLAGRRLHLDVHLWTVRHLEANVTEVRCEHGWIMKVDHRLVVVLFLVQVQIGYAPN